MDERRAMEREIEALIASQEELATPFQILTSVPSVGIVVGATLVADLPELGTAVPAAHRRPRRGCAVPPRQ